MFASVHSDSLEFVGLHRSEIELSMYSLSSIKLDDILYSL